MADRERLNKADELGALHAELAKMANATHPVRLGVAPDVSAKELRRAFLGLVKRFHPHRFTYLGKEHEKVANEVFLLVKEAHDAMMEGATNASGPARRRKRRTSAPPENRSARQTSVRFKSLRVQPAAAKASEAKDPDPEAPEAKREGETTGPIRPLVVPVRTRPTSSRRPGLDKSTPREAQKPREPAAPPPVDHSGLVAKLASEEESKLDAYREASKLLRAGRAAEARVAFRQLAVDNPTDKRYRTYMHFAWGREHELGGRFAEAATEYQRSLNVTPTFTPALEALEALEAKGDRPGVFGRFFRGRQK